MNANNQDFSQDLVAHGYAVLRQCIDKSLITEYQQAVIYRLGQLLDEANVEPQGDIYSDFLQALELSRQFDIQVELTKFLVYKELHKKLFLQQEVLEQLIFALGPDLEYHYNGEMVVNVKDVQDGYLVKKFHQEYWSGIGIDALQTWTPIAIKPEMGGIEMVDGSHLWGHIPHRNREPMEIPSDAQYQELHLEEGDMAIFHPLLLHRTVPNKHEHPRFAVALEVRNFNCPDTGFKELLNWEGFHYSPLSQIKKRLGNPHLSPFRTYGSQRTEFFRK